MERNVAIQTAFGAELAVFATLTADRISHFTMRIIQAFNYVEVD